MAQNNNQQQQNTSSAFEKEDAYRSLEMVNTWINNLDTKVSFALALVGVLIGVIFSEGLPNAFQRISEVPKLAELNGGEIIAALLVGILYLTSFCSVYSFMMAIIARVKNENNAPSIFFFCSIGAIGLQNYKDKVNHLTEAQLLEDLEEQIHANSKICSKKAKWYNKGIKLLVSTIILWFICMTFQLI